MKNFRFRKTAGFLSGAALAYLISGAQAGINTSCVSCALMERQKAMSPAAVVLSSTSSDNLTQGWNVASILNRPDPSVQASPLQFYSQSQVPQLPAGQTWWTGQGDLPGLLKSTWSFPATNFDPSFVTSYYNPQNGALNVASAPWTYAPAAGWAGGGWATLPDHLPSWTLTGAAGQSDGVSPFSLMAQPAGGLGGI